jgi:guanylate kinase
MKKKKTIVAIIGASGSGKTVLSLEMKRYGYPVICSYTTRPMRTGEVSGIDHIFVDEKDMPDKSEMLAYTYFGGYHYWAEKKQVDDVLPTLYVIDEKGLIDLKNNYKDEYNIYVVYVTRTNNDVDQNRKDRDNDRVKIDPSEIDLEIYNDYSNVNDFLDHAGKGFAAVLDTIFLD